jgi:hypothetical protein
MMHITPSAQIFFTMQLAQTETRTPPQSTESGNKKSESLSSLVQTLRLHVQTHCMILTSAGQFESLWSVLLLIVLKNHLLWCLWVRSNTSQNTNCREFLLPWVWTGSCSFSCLPLSTDPSYLSLRFIRTSETQQWSGPWSFQTYTAHLCFAKSFTLWCLFCFSYSLRTW